MDTVLILKMMTLQRFGFECLTLVQLGRNLPKNVFGNFENVPRKNWNLFLCMIQRKLHSFALTRTLYLLIYNHKSYINLNVPDVRQNILGKRTDVLNLGKTNIWTSGLQQLANIYMNANIFIILWIYSTFLFILIRNLLSLRLGITSVQLFQGTLEL